MSGAFTWEGHPVRVVLAPGALAQVPDELRRLGVGRTVVVGSGRSSAAAVARLTAALGPAAVAVIPRSEQHVPEGALTPAVAVVREAGADSVVSVGGGSAVGLAKAVALQVHVQLAAVPTTYAGSEMTPIWGRTVGSDKRTGRDPRVRPQLVVYDPELCRGMPPRLAAASGMNALAHCLEALWMSATGPMTAALAAEGARRLLAVLPAVVADPEDVASHGRALAAACLAGLALGEAGTGIHHRTCHVLGGGWALPHAETHAAVLPHATALVTVAVPGAAESLRRILGDDPAGAVSDLLASLRLPRSLGELGLDRAALPEAERRVLGACAGDPLATAAAVHRLLADAFAGCRPRAAIGDSSDTAIAREGRHG